MKWKDQHEELRQQLITLKAQTEELLRLNAALEEKIVVLEEEIEKATSPCHTRMNKVLDTFVNWSKVQVAHDLHVVASRAILERGVGKVCMIIFEDCVTGWKECAFHIDYASGVVYPLESQTITSPVLKDEDHYTFFPPSVMLMVLRKLRDECQWKIDFKE